MNIKLMTEHHLEFLSLKGGCTGSSESTIVKMPHFWKSHVAARICLNPEVFFSTPPPPFCKCHLLFLSILLYIFRYSIFMLWTALSVDTKCLSPDQAVPYEAVRS